jgi:hypothetical protein
MIFHAAMAMNTPRATSKISMTSPLRDRVAACDHAMVHRLFNGLGWLRGGCRYERSGQGSPYRSAQRASEHAGCVIPMPMSCMIVLHDAIHLRGADSIGGTALVSVRVGATGEERGHECGGC